MSLKKYLSIELSPGRAYISLINEGSRKKKIINSFSVTFSETCYANGMFYDTNREISSAIRNGLIENKILLKNVVVTVYSPWLKTDEMEVPVSVKKTLKQFVRQQLYSKNQITGDYVVDAKCLEFKGKDKDQMWIRYSYCKRSFLEDLAEIFKNAGLVPMKLIPLELTMEALFERCCDTSGFPILVHLNKHDLHIMFSTSDGSYSFRSTHLGDNIVDSTMVLKKSETERDAVSKVMDYVVPNILNITRSTANTMRPGEGKSVVYFYGDRDYIMAAMEQLNVTGIVSCELVKAQIFDLESSDFAVSYFMNVFSAMDVIGDEEAPCDLFSSFADDVSVLSDKRVVGVIVLTALIVILMSGYSLVTNLELKAANKRISEYTEVLSDGTVAEALLSKQALEKEVAYYRGINASCESYVAILDKDKCFDSDVMKQIEDLTPPGVSITTFTFDKSLLTISCLAYEQDAPANFTKLLSGSGNYVSVTYTGFSKSTDADGNDVYSFNLSITLW